jgi:single stranded DNA-binding protein
MRGLNQDRSARVIVAGHALVQNLRRGHYELAVEEPAIRRLTVAFDELALVIWFCTAVDASARLDLSECNSARQPGRGPRAPVHRQRHPGHQPAGGVTQRVQDNGTWRDGDTSFFKVNVWRGQAEHLADSLAKGDRVMVTGRLRQRSWETPEGEKRSVAEIEADEVGASLKFATAKVERATERGGSDRPQSRERQAERGGDFNEPPPFWAPNPRRPRW